MPKLTEEQCRALDAVHFAATENLHIEPWLTGDLVFFNNRRVLHGREAFIDPPEGKGGERHILRMYLGDEELGGPPPEHIKVLYDWVYKKDWRSEEEDWPLEPNPA